MSQDIVPTATDPARAFEELRGEVSLLRRAVQGLTAERENAPDYLPTLQQLAERLDWLSRKVERISKAPAMELTVDTLATRIEQASDHARKEASRLVADANAAARASIARIDAVVERGWSAERQWRQLLWTAAIAFVLGIIICFALQRVSAWRTAHHTAGYARSRPRGGPPDALDVE
jgi:type VI protein secretion system component VasF